MRRLTFCAAALLACCVVARAGEPPHSAELDDMIARQAKRHGVPETLVRRIVMRESKFNPRARNHSFWGLMQISYPTAKSMGFKGTPSELLDPVINLTYAVPYLANAFIIAGKEENAAVRLYASGYYTTAKNHNLLSALRTAESPPLAPDDGFLEAATKPVTKLMTAVVEGPRRGQMGLTTQVTAAQDQSGPSLGAQVTGGQGPSGQGPSVQGLGAQGPGGPGDGSPSDVMMTAGPKGNQLPKKWMRDGGTTVIARGEQRVEQIAAYAQTLGVSADAEKHVVSHGKTKKTTEFASLDAPSANAQAYAPPAQDGRDPFQQAAPQAAIAQATSGNQATAGNQAAAAGDATPVPVADTPSEPKSKPNAKPKHKTVAVADADASDDKPVKKATKPKHAHVAAKKGVTVAVKSDETAPVPAQQ